MLTIVVVIVASWQHAVCCRFLFYLILVYIAQVGCQSISQAVWVSATRHKTGDNGTPADSDTGNYIATPIGDLITLTAAHRFSSIGLTVGGDIEIAPEYDRVAPAAITGEISPA